MRRSLVVALFVAMLVVQPVTAASYPSAEAACGQTGDGEVLVAIFPGAAQLQDDDSQVVTGETTVYPGTEFKVALCQNGELQHTQGTEWELQSTPGLQFSNSTETTVTVTVTGEESGEENPIDVAGLVENKDLRGVTIDVRRASRATADVTDESVTIDFESPEAASNYESAEDEYLAARGNLSNATERLNRSAEALRSGEENASTVTNETVLALGESAQSVDARAATLEANLYGTAWSGSDSRALIALSAVQNDERTARTDAKNAMRNYLGALQTAERNAQMTVFLNLGGAAILGLFAGAVPGWWLTAQKLENVRFDQEVNSSVSYGPRLLARAILLAVVAFGLTLAVLFALGGLGKFGGLL